MGSYRREAGSFLSISVLDYLIGSTVREELDLWFHGQNAGRSQQKLRCLCCIRLLALRALGLTALGTRGLSVTSYNHCINL